MGDFLETIEPPFGNWTTIPLISTMYHAKLGMREYSRTWIAQKMPEGPALKNLMREQQQREKFNN